MGVWVTSSGLVYQDKALTFIRWGFKKRPLQRDKDETFTDKLAAEK